MGRIRSYSTHTKISGPVGLEFWPIHSWFTFFTETIGKPKKCYQRSKSTEEPEFPSDCKPSNHPLNIWTYYYYIHILYIYTYIYTYLDPCLEIFPRIFYLVNIETRIETKDFSSLALGRNMSTQIFWLLWDPEAEQMVEKQWKTPEFLCFKMQIEQK